MWVCPGSRACTKHLLKVNQGCPTESRTPAATEPLPAAPEKLIGSLMPASQKVRLNPTAIPVSPSLGGGAEHAHSLLIRDRYSGPDAVSNQTPWGSGRDVYARRWCSSVSVMRPRHKGMACLLRLTRMAPVSPHAHRVRPSSVLHSIGVSCFPSD
jgi:hypothetical protein